MKRSRLRKKSKSARSILIAKLDDIYSEYVRKTAGKCERCGSKRVLQCHHIFTRTRYATRWHEPNLVCLCRKCHLYWVHGTGTDTDDIMDFYYRHLGSKDAYNDMKLKSKMYAGYTKIDLQLMIKEMCEKLKKGKE